MSSTEQYAQLLNALENKDAEYLKLVAEVIVMSEEAKQVLRKKGYGWTGLDLLQTCLQVPNLPYYDE